MKKTDFLKTRILSPKELIEGIKDPIWQLSIRHPIKSIRSIMFSARYKCGKAIEGYDFFDTNGQEEWLQS